MPSSYRQPSNDQQDAYWLLRSRLTRALTINWLRIACQNLEVLDAEADLRRFLNANPNVEFKIFRPEDTETTDHVGCPTFLR